MLYQILRYFGSSTRAPKFSTRILQFFIIKISITIKVNTLCGGVSCSSQDLGNWESVCQEFNSQGPGHKVLGKRFSCPGVLGPRDPGP